MERNFNTITFNFNNSLLFLEVNSTHTQMSQPFLYRQAFGVGAFEDDDDDIYGVDSLSNYDISMSKEDEKFNHGWSGGPKNEKLKGHYCVFCLLFWLKHENLRRTFCQSVINRGNQNNTKIVICFLFSQPFKYV